MENFERVLTVCSGNTCRSYIAAALLTSWGYKVRSAGTWAEDGKPANPMANKALVMAGIPVIKHRAQSISKELVDWATVILVAEEGHRWDVK